MLGDARLVGLLTAVPMAGLLLAFGTGIVLLALPFGYPGHRWEMQLFWILAAGAVVFLARKHPFSAQRALAGALILVVMSGGYLYGSWRMSRALDAQVPGCADEQDSRFQFRILDDPVWRQDSATGTNNASFRAFVEIESAAATCSGQGRHELRLSWYGAPVELGAGQRWQALGKLRPPWGYRNPGGFDYERWLLGEGLHGTGYVRSASLLGTTESPGRLIGLLRQRLKAWLSARDVRHGSLVQALMIGDDSAISSDQWRWLRNSGTIHLVVVSGLHVGMIAGFLYLAAGWVVRLFPSLLLAAGARRVASGLAILGSAFYVVLAGSGVPAVRAWLMSGLVLLATASGRTVSIFHVLVLALFVALATNPLVVHQQGFWLSFAAVAALVGFFAPRTGLFLNAGSPRARVLVTTAGGFLQAQVVLLVALSPVLTVTQGLLPLHSPLANILAVPLVTLVILPLVLLVGLLALWLPELAEGLLLTVDALLEFLMVVVRSTSEVDALPVSADGLPELALLVICVIGAGLAPGWRAMLLCVALWFAVLLPDPNSLESGGFRLTAFDVGQGSAILVETRGHSLIYDTGAAYPSGFNLGDAVVVPSFRASGSRLDSLVLSHDDLDHTGGAGAVVHQLDPERLWTSFDYSNGAMVADRCLAGIGWIWDGVRFGFLHPDTSTGLTDNDRSCVLLIDADGTRALLAGDISARIERSLPKAPVQLVFAPHHGSRTSSSMSFVRGFRPGMVFVSSARRSRYGHPHPDVVSRYEKTGARVFVTGWQGALIWESGEPESIRRWRHDEGAYWHRRDLQ